ncbi:double zinc ribbon [Oxobacter pfennigii]|uniref:Double zinc ribbon n=1 Tax=Oxobacter pfennigii TaxID=36849 RepID=A0A0P9ABG2_9CLOT|nr:SPFH domain-containing protein [Oxobacter pfennigii]KPU42410.1 double zinc ribbon [Oxobacter pfennigii]
MGLFDFIKSQFIEVIEWTDDSLNTMVYRFPVHGKEIKMGAQLTVRESQAAVFVNEGQVADVFGPGRYSLDTQNMPVLTKLKSWQYGFNSPFKAEVYFVNTKQFTDQKWGTTNPVMMRDAEFGMLRLRAFGIFSFRIADPVKFLKEILGTNGEFDTESIAGQLRRSIVSGISDLLGETKVAAIDLAMYYDELSSQAKEKLQPRFDTYGLTLTSFFFENISLPEEVEKVLDKRTSMGVIGNMQQYAQYQAAEAIKDAANNPGGGIAGAGVGLGAGAALGNMMGEAFKTMNQLQQPMTMEDRCPGCNSRVPAGYKFCPQCGKPMAPPSEKCIKCGSEIDQGTKFCPECGTSQAADLVCKGCGNKLKPGSKFCPECGNKMQ